MGKGYLFPARATIRQMNVGAKSLMLRFSGWLTGAPINIVSSAALPRQGTGPAFLSVAAGKGEGQSLSARGSREKGAGHLSLIPTTMEPQTREVVPATPLSHAQVWLTHAPVYRINSVETFLKKIIYYDLCTYVMHMPRCSCRDQRIIFGS